MTTRAEFEKWASENWIDGLPKMIALRAWEASRAAALEEVTAALRMEKQMYDGPATDPYADRSYSDSCDAKSEIVGDCIDIVSALAKSEGENNGRP